MLSPKIQWKLAQLKQAELLQEAQKNQLLQEAQQGKPRLGLWQGLTQSLGDQMIAAGHWLKAAARPAKPAPTPAAPKSCA